MSILPLTQMDQRHGGLTPVIAAYFHEAACVCLSRHHSPPTTFTIEDNGPSTTVDVEWEPPNARTSGAWANQTDTTEAGAYGCVLAGIELARGCFAVRRAETGTGSDYYIGPAGSGMEDLEDCYRLEVSGVDEGGAREIRQRVLLKMNQARQGNSNLPAIAGVVGFAARVIALADVGESE